MKSFVSLFFVALVCMASPLLAQTIDARPSEITLQGNQFFKDGLIF
jgi:hypothetical protein